MTNGAKAVVTIVALVVLIVGIVFLQRAKNLQQRKQEAEERWANAHRLDSP